MEIADARQPGEDPRLARAVATEIGPRIPELEERRHALAGACWRDAVLLSIAAAVAAAHAGVRGAEAFVPFIVLAAVVAGALLHSRRRQAWEATMIEAVMPAICRFLGVTRYRSAGDAAALESFETLGLVAPCRYRSVAHHFEAWRGGTRFAAQHATLRSVRGRRGWATQMFHGLLVRASVRLPPPTRILIVAAGETTAQMPPSGSPPFLVRLHLGDPRFEGIFHVLTAPLGPRTAARARDYLAPSVREALIAIGAEEARGRQRRASLRAAFDGDGFYLALPRVEWPEIGPFRIGRARPFLDPGGVLFLGDLEATVRAMADDAAAPGRIVDRLAGS